MQSMPNANSGESNASNYENQEDYDKKIRVDEESAILELFTRVLDTIIARKNIKEDDVDGSIQPMKDSFKPRVENTEANITFHKTDFTQWENICVFLFRYGSHGAGFARYRILNAIRNCTEVENTLKKPDLKIISLGSGPGNDAVGLCSALSELQYPKSLKLTLVDKFEDWDECIKLVESFIKSENFGKVSELFKKTNVEFQFIQVDLPGNLKSDKKYFKLLGEADVIVASKFFTSLDRAKGGEIEKAIIKSLHEQMKEDALLLVNDILVRITERWSDFRHAYNSDEEEKYKMTTKVTTRFNSDDNVESILPIHVFVKESAK